MYVYIIKSCSFYYHSRDIVINKYTVGGETCYCIYISYRISCAICNFDPTAN